MSKTYSQKAGWSDFQKALAAANAILQGEEELEAKDYLSACEKLKQAYLTVDGKTALTGELSLSLSKQGRMVSIRSPLRWKMAPRAHSSPMLGRMAPPVRRWETGLRMRSGR